MFEHGIVFLRLFIDFGVVFVGSDGEVYFRLDDVIERAVVTECFLSCLVGVQNIVRTGRQSFGDVLRRAYAPKGLMCAIIWY